MNEDIDNLLTKWYETKEEIAILENKCIKYKKIADRIMNDNGQNTISNSKYTLQKKRISKSTLGKNDVPGDVWDKYSKRTSYDAFYISKIKDKKKK